MKTPQETVNYLFVNTDDRNWTNVENIFASEVILDYSSMNGQPAAILTPQQITNAWKTILPGFKFTHHQTGNFLVNENDKTATVFCYGTATHYLENEKGNLWTVVGSYNFDLVKDNKSWKISKMKFNYKYQTGNTSLPSLAIEKLKK